MRFLLLFLLSILTIINAETALEQAQKFQAKFLKVLDESPNRLRNLIDIDFVYIARGSSAQDDRKFNRTESLKLLKEGIHFFSSENIRSARFEGIYGNRVVFEIYRRGAVDKVVISKAGLYLGSKLVSYDQAYRDK